MDSSIEAVLGSTSSQRITAVPAPARAVHRAILCAFAASGVAPTRAQLDDDLTVELLVADDLIGLDEHGEISYAYPFSTRPTAHQVQLPRGARPYAMCAIDALGIPVMLDTDAIITSRDTRTGGPITITVTDHGTTAQWQPPTAVVFAGSRMDCCATTSAESCCGFLNFFTNRENALSWAAEHPEIYGTLLDQEQALAAGRHCFGSLLQT